MVIVVYYYISSKCQCHYAVCIVGTRVYVWGYTNLTQTVITLIQKLIADCWGVVSYAFDAHTQANYRISTVHQISGKASTDAKMSKNAICE